MAMVCFNIIIINLWNVINKNFLLNTINIMKDTENLINNLTNIVFKILWLVGLSVCSIMFLFIIISMVIKVIQKL